jgi:hypothetical protein
MMTKKLLICSKKRYEVKRRQSSHQRKKVVNRKEAGQTQTIETLDNLSQLTLMVTIQKN